MKRLFAVLLFALLLVACEKQAEVTEPIDVGVREDVKNTVTSPEPEEKEEVKETFKVPTQAEISAAEQAGLDCLSSKGFCLVGSSVDAKVGDTVLVSTGTQNMLPRDTEFAITVYFARARASIGTAPIEADRETMNGWIVPQSKDSFILGNEEKFSKPILIKVGEMVNPDKGTVPGEYIFEVVVNTKDEYDYLEPYRPGQQVSITVT